MILFALWSGVGIFIGMCLMYFVFPIIFNIIKWFIWRLQGKDVYQFKDIGFTGFLFGRLNKDNWFGGHWLDGVL